jgi:hypothetical protein
MKADGFDLGTLEEFRSFQQLAAPLMVANEAPRFEEGYKERLKTFQNHFCKSQGIVCFSEIENDPKMWGTYADSHRGMLVEFDCNNSYFKRHSEFKKVMYSQQPVPFDPESSDDFLRQVVFTKNSIWSEELEWRAVFRLNECRSISGGPQNPPLFFTPIPLKMITKIVLAHRCPPTVEAELRRLISQNKVSIRLQRATIVPGKTRFEYVGI